MGLFSGKTKDIKLRGMYASSHPLIKNQRYLSITLTDADVKVYGDRGKALLHTFQWSDIVGFDSLTESEIQSSQRVTATRLLTVGVFALAAPKKSGSVKGKMFEVLQTTTGDIQLETMVAGGAPSGLTGSGAQLTLSLHQAKARTIKSYVNDRATGQLPSPSQPVATNRTDELREYAKLRDDGIITQAEFDNKKAQLLGLS